MEELKIINDIINLKPEEFRKVRKAIVERGLAEPTLKELVAWIFEDLGAEVGESIVSMELKKKYEFIVRESRP